MPVEHSATLVPSDKRIPTGHILTVVGLEKTTNGRSCAAHGTCGIAVKIGSFLGL